MDTEQFLELTASDAWLTADQIAALLDRGGYWPAADGSSMLAWRLAHVEQRLNSLRTVDGRRAFVPVEVLAPDRSVMRVWKQQRLIGGAGPRWAERGTRPSAAYGTRRR